MPAIWSPGRILVDAFTRQLLHPAIAQRDRHDLEPSCDLRLKGDDASVGRPRRVRSVALIAGKVRREQLYVRAIHIARIDLRVPGAAGRERQPPPVRTERRRHVITPATHRDATRVTAAGIS